MVTSFLPTTLHAALGLPKVPSSAEDFSEVVKAMTIVEPQSLQEEETTETPAALTRLPTWHQPVTATEPLGQRVLLSERCSDGLLTSKNGLRTSEEPGGLPLRMDTT